MPVAKYIVHLHSKEYIHACPEDQGLGQEVENL